MFSFYTLDLTNLIIIIVTAFISYKIFEKKDEKDNTFIVLGLSLVIGLFFSLLYSYLTLESDNILTSNFWE